MENKYLYAVNVLLNSATTTVSITDNEDKAMKKKAEAVKKCTELFKKDTFNVWVDYVPIEDCEIGKKDN